MKMSRILKISSCLLVLTQLSIVIKAEEKSISTGQFSGTDRLIVKVKENSDEKLNEIVSNVSRVTADITQTDEVVENIVKTTNTGAQVIQTETMSEEEQVAIISELESDENIEYAEPDLLVTTHDAHIEHQIKRFDYIRRQQWHLSYNNIQEIWKKGYTGKGVVIGINDSGYQPHPDLEDNYIGGYDFVSDTKHSRDGDGRDEDPTDEGEYTQRIIYDEEGNETHRETLYSVWHGTYMAGIIAGSGKNHGITGVAFNAKFTAGRSIGPVSYLSDVADAFAWLGGLKVYGVPDNPNPAKVINGSLGTPIDKNHEYAAPVPRIYRDTFRRLRNNGVVVVVSAGNEDANANRTTPANANDVIVVGAIDRSKNKTWYSNWGDTVDVYATGDDIFSTINKGLTKPLPKQFGYDFKSGTSAAAPIVTGLVALMLEKNPKLTPLEIENILKETADIRNDDKTGEKMRILNAKAAFDYVESITPQPTDSSPQPTDSSPQPTDSSPQPTDSSPQPTDSSPQPTDSSPQPTDSSPQPTPSVDIPVTIKTYHSKKSSTFNFGYAKEWEQSTDGSIKQEFEHATIYAVSGYEPAMIIKGSRIDKYIHRHGGIEKFGFPISDEIENGRIFTQEFIKDGKITTVSVVKSIWD